MSVEFDCIDCGTHVFSAGAETMPEPARCFGCQFISEQPEEDRDQLRRLLGCEREQTAFRAAGPEQ